MDGRGGKQIPPHQADGIGWIMVNSHHFRSGRHYILDFGAKGKPDMKDQIQPVHSPSVLCLCAKYVAVIRFSLRLYWVGDPSVYGY